MIFGLVGTVDTGIYVDKQDIQYYCGHPKQEMQSCFNDKVKLYTIIYNYIQHLREDQPVEVFVLMIFAL